MTKPDVTVVVPTRNRADLVDRLLRQLAALVDDSIGAISYEVVVIDEGSTDGTPELLDRYQRDHGFVVVTHDPPVGLPAARNVGLAMARAPYVAWIDDDDLTAPDRLWRQLEGLRRSGHRWSCAARVDIDDDLNIVGHLRCPADGDELLPSLLTFNTLPSAAQGLVVERQLALDVGGYDESLRAAEDWEFCIRLAAVGPAHLLDEPLVGYRIGFASMSTDTGRMDTAIKAVADKHRDLLERFGVDVDQTRVDESLLAAELLNSRWQAMRRAARIARRTPSLHRCARVVLVTLAPRWFAERSAARRHAQVPDEWRRQAAVWLAAVSSSRDRPATG